MNGKGRRTYDLDGRPVTFDTRAFKDLFRHKSSKAGQRLCAYEKTVADAVFVGADTIHSWRMGCSSPGDLGKVEALAAFWGVRRDVLLKDAKEKIMADALTDRQLEALRRIYAAIVDYLDDFEHTMGFNDYWFDIVDAGTKPEHAEIALYELVEKKHRAVVLAAKREAFDLRDKPIYDALLDYIWDDLVDIYGDKLSYAYRFEATGEPGGGVPTSDDYERAYKRLHEILDE